MDAMFAVHQDAGACIRQLRDEAMKKGVSQSRFSYFSDRVDAEGERPAREYFLDAQYGIAPIIMAYQDPQSDFYVLDFVSKKNLDEFMILHSLAALSKKGSCVLAFKEPS